MIFRVGVGIMVAVGGNGEGEGMRVGVVVEAGVFSDDFSGLMTAGEPQPAYNNINKRQKYLIFT